MYLEHSSIHSFYTLNAPLLLRYEMSTQYHELKRDQTGYKSSSTWMLFRNEIHPKESLAKYLWIFCFRKHTTPMKYGVFSVQFNRRWKRWIAAKHDTNTCQEMITLFWNFRICSVENWMISEIEKVFVEELAQRIPFIPSSEDESQQSTKMLKTFRSCVCVCVHVLMYQMLLLLLVYLLPISSLCPAKKNLYSSIENMNIWQTKLHINASNK